MIKRDKERCKIRAVQMDNFRGLLGSWRRDKVLNALDKAVVWSDERCGPKD